MVSATIFLALFLEAGVAVAAAAVAFLFGVLGCGVVLVLLSWRVEERAPYLWKKVDESVATQSLTVVSVGWI